jgi:hypothetical protein
MADPHARGGGAQGKGLQSALFQKGNACLDKRLLQVAVVIGPVHRAFLPGNVSAVNFWLDGSLISAHPC